MKHSELKRGMLVLTWIRSRLTVVQVTGKEGPKWHVRVHPDGPALASRFPDQLQPTCGHKNEATDAPCVRKREHWKEAGLPDDPQHHVDVYGRVFRST